MKYNQNSLGTKYMTALDLNYYCYLADKCQTGMQSSLDLAYRSRNYTMVQLRYSDIMTFHCLTWALTYWATNTMKPKKNVNNCFIGEEQRFLQTTPTVDKGSWQPTDF